jgi:hypothetical protein
MYSPVNYKRHAVVIAILREFLLSSCRCLDRVYGSGCRGENAYSDARLEEGCDLLRSRKTFMTSIDHDGIQIGVARRRELSFKSQPGIIGKVFNTSVKWA